MKSGQNEKWLKLKSGHVEKWLKRKMVTSGQN